MGPGLGRTRAAASETPLGLGLTSARTSGETSQCEQQIANATRRAGRAVLDTCLVVAMNQVSGRRCHRRPGGRRRIGVPHRERIFPDARAGPAVSVS